MPCSFSICWPGSTHDTSASETLFRDLIASHEVTPGHKIVVDQGFKKFHGPFFARSLEDGETATYAEARTSAWLTKVRQGAEWINATLKATFLRLTLKLPYERYKAELIFKAAILLLNLRTEMVGFNEIKTVYSNAMLKRTWALHALYNRLREEDGIDRGESDDIVSNARGVHDMYGENDEKI